MNFLVDESVDAGLARALRADAHCVTCIWETIPSADDDAVLALAERTNSILITADRDFGELVFRLGRAHQGVLLIRLAGLPLRSKTEILCRAVDRHGNEMAGAFTVVTAGLVRIRKPSSPGNVHR